MSAFLSVDLLTDFAAFCLTDYIDWRYILSWFVFSTQLVNCCPLPPSQCTVYCTGTYKIASQPQTKMTSKDDIKKLVSLCSFVHGKNGSIPILTVT